MKVAIITLHRVYNYGSALQAYATQTVFEKAGYEAERSQNPHRDQ